MSAIHGRVLAPSRLLAPVRLVVALTLGPLAAPAVAAAGDDLRVVTYNVTNLDQETPRWRVRQLADDLARLDGDVVFLQEVADAAAVQVLQAELAKRPIARYETFRMDLGWLEQEVVLLTRVRPARFRRYDFPGLSTSLDRVVFADFDLPGGAVRFVAAHLKAGIRDDDAARTRNYQIRQVLADLVRPALAQGTRVVVLGDLNDIDRALRYANGRAPADASRVFDLVRAEAPELRVTDADLPVPERITSSLGYMYDHFLVDARLAGRVTVDRSGLANGVEPSDHWPLVLDLALAARPLRGASAAARAVGAGAPARDDLHVAGGGRVRRDVAARVVVRHPRPEELEVRLAHAGREVTLLDAGEHDEAGRSLDRRLLTRAFDGLPADGPWTLTVTYRGHAAVAGELVAWELHGAAE